MIPRRFVRKLGEQSLKMSHHYEWPALATFVSFVRKDRRRARDLLKAFMSPPVPTNDLAEAAEAIIDHAATKKPWEELQPRPESSEKTKEFVECARQLLSYRSETDTK